MSPVVARPPRPLKKRRAAQTSPRSDHTHAALPTLLPRTTSDHNPSALDHPRRPPRPSPKALLAESSFTTLPSPCHPYSESVHYPGKSCNPLPNARRLARAPTLPAPSAHPPRSARRAPVHPPSYSPRACQTTFPVPGACAEPPNSPLPPRLSRATPRRHLPWPRLPAALSLAPEPCKLAPQDAPKPTPAGPASPLGKPGRRACVPPKGPVPGRYRLVMPLETSTRSRLLAHRPQPQITPAAPRPSYRRPQKACPELAERACPEPVEGESSLRRPNRRPPGPAKNHPAAPQEFFGKNSYCARGPQIHPRN